MTDLSLHYKTRIEKRLQALLPDIAAEPQQLNAAMHYTVTLGGKRIRPMLVYATGELLGASLENLDYPAAAVELIHTYSLIHDDLPAMDNADLRRGKPACHIQFGEAIAILTGDALLPLAYELLSAKSLAQVHPTFQLKLFSELTTAIGYEGMVGGQVFDIMNYGENKSVTFIEKLYRKKTGALIHASIKLGAYTAECDDIHFLKTLDELGEKVGLAFQIQDDILDIVASEEVLGKTKGLDIKLNKNTYPAVLGLEQSKQKLAELSQEIFDVLNQLPHQGQQLKSVVEFILGRKN